MRTQPNYYLRAGKLDNQWDVISRRSGQVVAQTFGRREAAMLERKMNEALAGRVAAERDAVRTIAAMNG